MAFAIPAPANLKSWLSIIKIVVTIFTLVYAFDVLVLHRKFSDLGKAMASNVTVLTFGIFITVLSVAVASFGLFENFVIICQIIGVGILGVYFRSCVHSYIKKSGGGFLEKYK
ncbi:MAG: hypothetical protein V1839_00945 [archaeon]